MQSCPANVLRSSLLMIVAALVGCAGESSPPPMPENAVERGGDGYEWSNSNDEYTGYVMDGSEGGGGDEVASSDSSDYDYGESQDPYAAYDQQQDGYGGPDEGGEPPADRDGYGNDGDPYASTTDADDYDPYAVTSPADQDGDDYGETGGDGDVQMTSAGGASRGTGTFATQIEPILREHCFRCHGGGERSSKGDLVLTAAELPGSGVVVAQKPDDSELFLRVTMSRSEKGRMPPQGRGLSEEQVEQLKTWIEQGANVSGNQGGGGGGDGYGDAYAAYGGYGDDGGGDRGGRDDDYDDDDYGEGGNGRGPAAPAPPKNLAETAGRTFLRGHDKLAMNQLFAQALVQSDDASGVLAKYRWVPGLKRPQLAVRWGVGIKYHAKGGFEGAPRPVGVNQDIPGLDDDDFEYDDEPQDFTEPQLAYYTGKIGEELVFRLQSRIERGYYGEVLREQLEARLSGPRDEDGFGQDDGYSAGGGSSDGYGGYGGGYGGGGGGGGGSDDKPDNRVAQIMPGVTMLGTHDQSDLLEMATEEQLDLLVVLDIVVDRNFKARLVTNSTKVRLYDVRSGKQVASSGKLDNVAIQREMAENSDQDPEDTRIIREMDKIFTIADEAYRVKEFPQGAQPKHAITFVKNLLADPSPNPLWKLSEVRFYESRGLLKPEHAASAFKRISPEHADALRGAGEEEQVKTLFASYLAPPQRAGAEGVDGDDFDDEDSEEDAPRRRRREFR